MIYDKTKKLFLSSLINHNGIYGGFGTKTFCNGLQINNIINLKKTFSVNCQNIVVLKQIHSTNIKLIKPIDLQNQFTVIEDTDGVITKENNVALVVRTADCVPMIIVDAGKGIVGISHQGWRGSLKKMAQLMVSAVEQIGGSRRQLTVALGPAINLCCYSVTEDRYLQFREVFDGYSKKVFKYFNHRFYINLIYLNYLQLIDIGINPKHIDYLPICTCCDSGRFFSFRREHPHCRGEMISFVINNRKM